MFEPFVPRKNKNKNKKKKTDGKIGSKIKQSPWAELQDDLLVEINKRLLLSSDQVRFHAVCKNWLAVYQHKPMLPWVIKISYHQRCRAIFYFELFEPSDSSNLTGDPTFVYKVNLLEYGIYPHSSLYGISNTIHKNGWIYCSVKDECLHEYIFLFSPFKKKTIKLHLKSKWCEPSLSTFSVDPNSRDCVFLLLYHDHISGIEISTIRRFGDEYKNWTTRKFDTPAYFKRCGKFPEIPVYIKGTFYFVFPVGKLASYNVERHEWRIESVICSHIFPKCIIWYDIYEAFELNGELMLICIHVNDLGFVARFDWFKKAWFPLESLGNNSLFCTKKSVVVCPIGKEERNRGVLPNKIYYGRSSVHYDKSVSIVYSLKSGKLTKFMKIFGIGSWDWFEPPPPLKKIPSQDFRRKNNPKQSVLPIVAKQYTNGTDRDIDKMDQTGEGFLSEEDDDELESMRILYQMRRARYVPRGI